MSKTKLLVNELPMVREDCPFCHDITFDSGTCAILIGPCKLWNGMDCPCLMSYAEYDREQTNKYIQTLDGKRVLIPNTKRTSRGVKEKGD